MAKTIKRLSVRLTDKEQIWAIIYLLFSIFLLPDLLVLFNQNLPVPMGKLWINFLYFTIHFDKFGNRYFYNCSFLFCYINKSFICIKEKNRKYDSSTYSSSRN